MRDPLNPDEFSGAEQHERPEELDGDQPLDTPDAPQHDGDGVDKPGGLGEDGTIPDEPEGVAAGLSDEKSNFEPEEDEEA